MASKDDKSKEFQGVRRALWPAMNLVTKIVEENNNQTTTADDIQQQVATSVPTEDERRNVFLAGINEANREIKSSYAIQNQEMVTSGLTDEERREAFLADLDEGPYVNIGRPILVPISRLGRTKFSGANARTSAASSDGISSTDGFRNNSPGVLCGSVAPAGTHAPFTPTHLRSLSAGEAPRSNKAIRLANDETTGTDIDPKGLRSGAFNPLVFDPSPKRVVALDIKEKATVSPRTESPMEFDVEPAISIPSPPFHGFHREEDESPSLRRQMERLRVTSGSGTGLPTGPSSFGRSAGHPLGPRPYSSTARVPQTPTKGKRARGEFEKTTTLSGRDVAREREILARFAAAAKEEDDEKEEEDEDEEDTPKASVLNRHMDLDKE